jgi:4-amino-4-deoxy-L-arabinose transferase-like glycosyltransferase
VKKRLEMRGGTVTRLALMAIMLLAAYLRLSNLELTEFKLDEAHVCSKAAEFLASGRPPLVGIGSSVGAANPPLFIYLTAIPVSLSKNPTVIAGFIALLNVGAVLGCYLLAREYFGEKVALIATLLFAVSPWAVFYSRKIWAQDSLPPFVGLFFAAVFSTLVKRKPRQLILVFLWLACLIQLHLSALALIPLVALLLLVFRSRIRLIPLLAGLLVFALIFAPYIYYDATHGWINLRTFIEVSRGPATFDLKSAQYAAQIMAGQGYHALAGASFKEFLAEIMGFTWLNAVETWLLISGVAFLAWQVLRGCCRRRTDGISDEMVKFTILLSWLLLPVLFYVRHTTPVYPHYFILLYPVQFIIIGVFVVRVLNWAGSLANGLKPSPLVRILAGRVPPISLVAMILGLALWQVHLTGAFYSFVDRNDTSGGHGLPVKYHLQAAESLRRLAEGAQVLILSEGDVPAWHETPAVFDFLLRPEMSPRFISYQEALVFPSADALYLLAPGDTPAVPVLDGYAEEIISERISLRGGPDAFRFYRFEAESLTSIKASLADGDTPAALDNGVEILGYDVSGEVSPGGDLRLALYWTVQAVPDASYHFFNHLVDDEGQRWGQRDGPGYPAGQWREGDVLVGWFDISVSPDAPPGEYWVLMGMYAYPEGVKASVLDERGQPIGDSLRLGPIEIDRGSSSFHENGVNEGAVRI